MGAILDHPITLSSWQTTLAGKESEKLVLNGHRAADGQIDTAKIENTYLVEQFDFSRLDIRDQRSGLHLLTGGDFGVATKQFRHISLRGQIRAPDPATLEDMIAELFAALDIERLQAFEATAAQGEIELDFRCPTAISGTHIDELVAERFYCRPEGYPIVYERRSSGLTALFAMQLVCARPARNLLPQEVILFSAAAGWSQFLPNWTRRMGAFVSDLSFRVTMTGAGSSNFSLSDAINGVPLELDLGDATSGTFMIDMGTRRIYTPTNPKDYWRDSPVDTFFGVPPGGATVTVLNTANVASVEAIYHQSRA